MTDGERTAVMFGGEVHEHWTAEGLDVSYTGGVRLLAQRGKNGWEAAAPIPCGGDVKSDIKAFSKATELACAINEGRAHPLVLAYFRAACLADEGAPAALRGGFDSLLLPEALRLLLDRRRMNWEDAVEEVSRRYAYDASEPGLHFPLGAVSALQPRTAGLIRTVSEKLTRRLRETYPGDWNKANSAAIISDGEVSFPMLSAALCGRVICSKERRSTEFRTLYTLFPEKFED